MARPASPHLLAVGFALLSLAALASAQNSCLAVAYLGQIGGTSCTGQELGDARMTGAGFGPCEEVTNASCVLTETSNGDCVIHLYSDTSCNTPVTGGNTVACGAAPENVNFGSFQVECA